MRTIEPIYKTSNTNKDKDSYTTKHMPRKKDTTTVLNTKFSDVLKEVLSRS